MGIHSAAGALGATSLTPPTVLVVMAKRTIRFAKYLRVFSSCFMIDAEGKRVAAQKGLDLNCYLNFFCFIWLDW